MATTTPNFGWAVPTSSDLVKNGATAIETLGDSIDASLVDLKGGTTGQVLSKATNTDMDFSWITPSAGGGGKVLQVVYGSYATQSSSTSTTYADSGLSLSITPSSASSKVLVFISQNLGMDRGGFGQYVRLQLLRGSTSISELGGGTYKQAWGMEAYDGGVTYNKIVGAYPVEYLDSPSSTSAVTYKTQFAIGQQPGGPTATAYVQPDSNKSTIILMEIGA
jgi:hypothetical protein